MPRYKGGSRAKGISGVTTSDLPFTDINPRLKFAEKYDDKLLRSEYRRMRDIAQKRLKRMVGKPEAQWVLEQHPEGFPMTRNLKDRDELVKALMDVSNFLNADRSSISGVRRVAKEAVKTIKKKTKVKIKKENLANVGRFINQLKKEMGIKSGEYDLKYVVDAWDTLKNKGKITKKELTESVLKVIQDEKEYQAKRKKKKYKVVTQVEADVIRERIKNNEFVSAKEKKALKQFEQEERAAKRVAYRIDRYFDKSDLSNRTIAGLKRRKKKK